MNQFKVRLVLVIILLFMGAAVIIGRLFTIQILNSARYAERSRDQTHQRKIIPALRGTITDRNGEVLAVTLQQGITLEPEMLGSGVRKKQCAASIKRVYPYGEVAGSVLGYVGKDGNGLGGTELMFDRSLRGEDGWTILQKDGRNQRYRKIGLPEKLPKNGTTVSLTIDIHVQKIAQGVLRQAVEALQAKNGLCIVMDPVDGSILAMANEPSFNPNVPSHYSIADRQNKCISMVYEPGSTFKLITASAAIEERIKSENDLIFGDNGSYQIYDQTIRDHVPYGYLTFAKALTYSSNICFAKIANELGNDRFYRYVRDYGFGEKTAIRLPGEECGIVHPVKKWSGRTRVTMAMGQEISTTLLQMMVAYGTVANGGILVCPNIMKKITDVRDVALDSSVYKPVRRVISKDAAERLRFMLADVVKNGTGKNAAVAQVEVAGKTGTSQKPDSGGYSQTRSWSSFIGFVPVDRPMLLCGVLIDEPAGGEMGGEAAAPYFKKIITQIVSQPDLEYAERILDRKDTSAIMPNNQMHCRVSETAGKYASEKKNPGTPSDSSLPDCIGKDMRDAVNMVNLNGFTPHTIGYGLVTRQVPPAGTKRVSAAACTLYCAVKG